MLNLDKLPIFFNELKIKEETTFQDLIAQFKQSVPNNFIQLEPAKKNNWGSTEGLDKPLCERYLFVWESKRIWLDIPHELMEKLKLPFGKTCPWSFYLDPEVLKKDETEGAITIENEEEFILDHPNKITLKDQEIQTEPNEEEFNKLNKLKEELKTQKQNYLDLERQKNGEITELRNQLNEKEQELKKWTDQFPNSQTPETVQGIINALTSQLSNANSQVSAWQNNYNSLSLQISQKNTQINNLTSQVNSLQANKQQITNLQSQLNTANSELAKERGWWDKWINEKVPIISHWITTTDNSIGIEIGVFEAQDYSPISSGGIYRKFLKLTRYSNWKPSLEILLDDKKIREIIKINYNIYRDK